VDVPQVEIDDESVAPTPKPTATAVAPKPTATAATPKPSAKCDPPFFVDSSGIKHIKPECM
jgi:hypothetical protein